MPPLFCKHANAKFLMLRAKQLLGVVEERFK
jgi:hypothetical protein